ncbi:MAG: UvrABC system protein A [Bacteroidia bacterium]|nr:MAG: UvrABC system protein A [Bacteroidia bacterium]
MAEHFIYIKNAQTHNLKGIDVSIPHNKLIVITGVSGSGKTSLAYDTLYAEGHRRYIESLSSYARQFVERLPKPPVDYIKGLSPCIALQQKVTSNNPRSTVGTATEIYDYLRVLFSRVGTIYHPVTGKEIKRHYPDDVLQFISQLPVSSTVYIANLIPFSSKLKKTLEELVHSGFSRVLINYQIFKIADVLSDFPKKIEHCFLIIDRVNVELSFDEDTESRLIDSIETAFNQGNGECYVIHQSNDEWNFHRFSNTLDADGIIFEEPTPQLFAFNNPYGICQKCKGTGRVFDFDPHKVFVDKDIPLIKGMKLKYEIKEEIKELQQFFPDIFSKTFRQLSPEEFETLWFGKNNLNGIYGILHYFNNYYKSPWYDPLSHLKSNTVCPMCKGSRLRKEALYIKVLNKTIADLVETPVDELYNFFKENLDLFPHKEAIQKLLDEIIHRLEFLCDVGLPYLTLNREMRTLSGGEAQRVYLTTALGSSLVGSIYILDEPTTGLHPRDTLRLINALKKLRDEGNTVIVVEHDEEVMRHADLIIDLGPKAGKNGGQIVFQGTFDEMKNANTLTADYLFERKFVEIASFKRHSFEFIQLSNANANNLQNITIQFPFNAITCITGVSGSGKSSLVEEELIPELEKIIVHHQTSEKISGVVNKIKHIHYLNQNSISTSSRSNCATYTKVFDDIRLLFSKHSKLQGIYLDPSYFSFNTFGGRCEKCEGEGIIRIPMQFMADIEMTCDECNGKRFKEEVLQVNYFNHSISDVLDISVEEAIELFEREVMFPDLKNKILKTLEILKSVGLGYIQLGQSTSKMSGGELQRLKIASFLQDEKSAPSLFILDEPSTGLHFYDIDILMKALHLLITRGHTIIIIEHQLDIIKNVDWIIDLGPEGGKNGGRLIYQGPLDGFLDHKQSFTAHFLNKKLTLKS